MTEPKPGSAKDPRPLADPMARAMRWLLFTGALLVAAMAVLLWTRPKPGAVPLSGTAPLPGASPLPVLSHLGDFTVTNQAGVRMDSKALGGRPWAIDLIFTRCPGPCALLSGVMRDIQQRLPADSPARLLSITSDPEYDTPAVLTEYAKRFSADTNRWQFVTGAKADIRALVTRQLLLVLEDIPEGERENPDDLFLHSTLIVIVDQQGRLRATVEGLQPGAADQVVAVLKALEE